MSDTIGKDIGKDTYLKRKTSHDLKYWKTPLF